MQKGIYISFRRAILTGLCVLILVQLFVACDNASTGVPQATITPKATNAATPTKVVQNTQTPTIDAQAPPIPALIDNGPASRAEPQFAYDTKHNELVLFGGKSFDGYLQDTWTWNGQTWIQQHPTASPGPVLGASMAYDAATGLVVFFGGSPIGGQVASNETWTWDGHSWTQMHPAVVPPSRTGASIVYDAAMGQLLLFGGLSMTTKAPLDDTWTWNGQTWTQLHPLNSPTARDSASITYDAAHHTVVLFGGDDESAPIPLLHDTWTWDGTNWIQQHPATSPEVNFIQNNVNYGAYADQTSLVLDESTQQVLLTLAGSDNNSDHIIQISWTWDGQNWTQQSIQNLPEQRMCLFYSSAQHAVYAFGYSITMTTFIDSLWQFNGKTWQVPA